MINKLDVTGVHYVAEEDVLKYVEQKIGKLDAYMNKHSRKSVHADVKLKMGKSKDKKQATCEVILHLPNETLTVHQSAVSMMAAIDMVEDKLKTQLKKYKDKHQPSNHRHLAKRLIGKLRR